MKTKYEKSRRNSDATTRINRQGWATHEPKKKKNCCSNIKKSK